MTSTNVLEMLADEAAAARKGVIIFGQVSIQVYNINKRRERRFDRVVRHTRETLFVAKSVILLGERTVMREAFEMQLLRLASIGFVSRNNRLLLDRQAGSALVGEGVRPLAMPQVLGAFEIWACLTTVAVLLFALECWSTRMDRRVRVVFE